jgi:hypothetical protein
MWSYLLIVKLLVLLRRLSVMLVQLLKRLRL